MFFDQGDWDEAEKLEVQNLEIRERVMGAEHADSVMSRACLAQTGFDHLFISYHFPTPSLRLSMFKAAPALNGKLPPRPRPVFDLQEVHVLPD